MFRFGVLERANSTRWCACRTEGFDMAVLPALLALGKGGGPVDSLNGS